MQKINTIITDLDGTILQNGEFANKQDILTLKEIQEQGYNVVICTGQTWNTANWVGKYLKNDKHLNYIICNNGGYISRVDTYQPEYVKFIDKQAVKKAYALAQELGLCIFLMSVENGIAYWNGIECPSKTLQANVWWTKYKFIKSSLNEFDNESIIQILFFVPSNIEKNFNNKITFNNYVTKNPSYIEDVPMYIFNSINVNKGLGIQNLAKLLNKNLDEFIVFGDAANDESMFKVATTSVAVGNATSELKKLATYVTDSNINGGVSKFIKEKILGEK